MELLVCVVSALFSLNQKEEDLGHLHIRMDMFLLGKFFSAADQPLQLLTEEVTY